ncbi:MAG: primosomal protein N', partial [Candidatus Saccharimonadales bacterium]
EATLPVVSIELISWLASYYPAPLGSITELFTPSGSMPKKDQIIDDKLAGAAKIKELPGLTTEQKRVMDKLAGESTVMLHGDTGTGKTRVYVELAKQAYEAGKSSIVLTPEIGLTAQLINTFREVFGNNVYTVNSHMTPAERRQIWFELALKKSPVIVIGPRSALFVPVNNIGFVAMDEAHDTAYKQEQSPYYQTSRVASRLAHLHKALFVMGTATPNITDYFAFKQKGLPILRMTEQAKTTKHITEHIVVDQRDRSSFSRSPWVADELLKSIEAAININEQSLLFLNRRGSARLVMCEACGWAAHCPNCDTNLTYHQDKHIMRCHSCDYEGKVPTSCPDCGKSELVFKSIGTKALETELGRLLPGARISRFDRDNTKQESIGKQYTKVANGDTDIIIGTQTIAKGFDLPNLSVVGVIQADSGLQIPDFTASERTYQLISQVSGRVGRGYRPGKLFIQTFKPDNSLIKFALNRDYASFYEHELVERKKYFFPPYVFLLKISVSRASSAGAKRAAESIVDGLRANHQKIRIEGPTPRFIEKLAGKYNWHIIVKTTSRNRLLNVIGSLPQTCTYNIDPNDLL